MKAIALVTNKTKKTNARDLLKCSMLQPEQPSLSSYLVMGLTATADSSPIAESTVTCETKNNEHFTLTSSS